jgi:hypothetical protein
MPPATAVTLSQIVFQFYTSDLRFHRYTLPPWWRVLSFNVYIVPASGLEYEQTARSTRTFSLHFIPY